MIVSPLLCPKQGNPSFPYISCAGEVISGPLPAPPSQAG